MCAAVIICLGAGPSQLPLITEARGLGHQVVAIDRNEQAPGLAVADRAIVASTHDADGVVARLRALDLNYAGLLARTCGPPLRTAARICAEFGLPGLSPELAELAVRKSTWRTFARANGVPAPDGWLADASWSMPTRAAFPLVVKPDQTVAGKQAIRVVTAAGELTAALAAACDSSGNGLAEVEALAPGCDVTWLTLADRGRSRPLFGLDELVGVDRAGGIRGLGVATPSITSGTAHEARMLAIMERLARLFPTVRAVLAFSFRVDPRGGEPVVIELHADLTGDLILDELLPAAYPDRRIMRGFVATVLGAEPEPLAADQARPTAVLTGGGRSDIVHGEDSRQVLKEAARRAGDHVFTHLDMPEAV